MGGYVELGLVGGGVSDLDQWYPDPWIQHYKFDLEIACGEWYPVIMSLLLHINSEVYLFAHIEQCFFILAILPMIVHIGSPHHPSHSKSPSQEIFDCIFVIVVHSSKCLVAEEIQ